MPDLLSEVNGHVSRTKPMGVWQREVGAGSSATKIDLFTRTAWAHDFISTPSLDAVFQALPGANFTVYGAGKRHGTRHLSQTVHSCG